MAAPIETSDEAVAEYINSLIRNDMGNIANENDLQEVISDYFVSRGKNGDDCDTDSDDSDTDTDLTNHEFNPHDSDGNEEVDEGDENSSAQSESESSYQHLHADEPSPGTDKLIQCKCKLNDGEPCYTRFENNELEDERLSCFALSREELDVCILSKLSCGMHLSSMTTKSRKGQQTVRKQQRTDFYFHGFRICREVFKLMHGIGQDKLNALIGHYKVAGIEARQHKNKKRLPHNALKFEQTKAVIDFINNYAECNAIILPGRTPGHWKTDVRLLPTNCSKKKVYANYCIAAEAAGTQKVSLRTFRRLWQYLIPSVVTMRPATDLCWFCQKGITKLVRSANFPDTEKSEAVHEYEEHLRRATMERSYYTNICKMVKDQLPQEVVLGPHAPCSFDGKCHYSFDFAQQVHYPSDPLQPGPIYFKCPRKCGLFGVACEALPKQVNFLLEESTSTGKGANCVVSMLHYFFENYGIGEKHVFLHADICSGQNKNSCMMWYLLWRVLTGRHKSITMSFLLTGHTKFSCDWCFGLVKRLYRKSKVDCLNDISNVVEQSSHVNLSQPCGREDGTVIVPTYDWTTFLGRYFRKIPAIKKYHHFYFTDSKSSVSTKEYSDSISVDHNIEKMVITNKEEMPPLIEPKGLDAKRQWYLFEEIRQFTAEDCKDVTAPRPLVPKPGRAVGSEMQESSDDDSTPEPRQKSRKTNTRR